MKINLYHYTSNCTQDLIVQNQEFWFREINDFNINNEDEELVINKYYSMAIKELKSDYPQNAFITKLPDNFNFLSMNILFKANYSFDQTKYNLESDIYEKELPSKIYLASFSEKNRSIKMQEKFGGKSNSLLEINKESFLESIKSYLSRLVRESFYNNISEFEKELYEFGEGLRFSYKAVIGNDIGYYRKVIYNSKEKVQKIKDDILSVNDIIISSKPFAYYRDKLFNLIYIDAHNFKESKFCFEKEIRLILSVPEAITEVIKVTGEKDMIRVTFSEKDINKLEFRRILCDFQKE